MSLSSNRTVEPGAPSEVSCTAEDGEVAVVWKAPETECNITEYGIQWTQDVQWTDDITDFNDSVSGLQEEYIIDNAIPDTIYYIEIMARIYDLTGIPRTCNISTPEKGKTINLHIYEATNLYL